MAVRHDIDTLGGGDRVQALETAAALRRLGHEVDVAGPKHPDPLGYDLVHLVNVQVDPYRQLLLLASARRRGVPVVLSTVYWNPAAWQQTGAAASAPAAARPKLPGTSRSALARGATDPSVRRWLLESALHRGSGLGTRSAKIELLRGVDAILPNGQAEADSVQADLAPARRVFVVPNGTRLPGQIDRATAQFRGRRDFVLSVGRIESRKNTVALVRAAAELHLPLVLIGNDTVEPEYVRQVRDEAGPEVLLVPESGPTELDAAYASARVHALASWFETPGLSSLEAAAAGCSIVSTEIGTTREHFGRDAFYCRPDDPASVTAALRAAWTSPPAKDFAARVARDYSWDAVGRATAAAYDAVLGG